MRVLAAILLWLSTGVPSTGAPVRVRAEGLRNAEGAVRLTLFRGRDGYPEAWRKAAYAVSVTARQGEVEAVFESVAPGRYALAVLHDENGNERLDRAAFGIPREGIGASNRAAERLGAPRFEEALFLVPSSGATLAVKIRYWL